MAIELVSLSSAEELALGESEVPTISADGQYVVFSSTAINLVSPDSNGNWDVFLRDVASGTTELISVNSDEEQGDAESWDAAISSDGTSVAFQSFATNLVTGDGNGYYDIFVRDLTTGTTERVSIDSIGGEANNDSYNPAISGDGRYVAFESLANDLVSGDNNNQYDIFRHDRQTGTTERVSITDGEGQSDGESRGAALSDDGNLVVFESDATNLVSGDTNGKRDVFVRDISAGATLRISVADDESQADGDSWGGELAANGQYYVFTSAATNLIGAGNDTNGFDDIFLRDLLFGTTERISISSTGEEANGNSWGASVSADGRYVTFQSSASNLVSSDTNGVADVFVHDRTTGETKRVVAFDGEQGNGGSAGAAISNDGSAIAFISSANNLVEDDDNAYADAFVASNPPTPPALTLDILAASSGFPDWEPMTGSTVMPVTPPAPSATLVVWPNADGTVTHVIGHDFTYAMSGEPTGGIVTAIEHRTSYNGTVLAQGSGLNHSLVQIYEYLSSDAPDALYPFFSYILNGDDTITSADTDDTYLAGFAGDDVITAGGGDDEIDGGIGADTIDGGAGDDAIDGGSQRLWDVASYENSLSAVEIDLATATAKGGDAEGDTLTSIEGVKGSAGNDTLTGDVGSNLFWGGLGDDLITGGSGDDTVSYENAATPVTVDLGAGTATGGHGSDTLVGIEDVQGSAKNDSITGDGNANTLWGGPGDDTLDGAGGSDTVSYWGMLAAVNANLATGTATVVGFGTDTLSNFEGIQGTEFADTLTGDAGDNFLEGRDGADTLDGGGGSKLGDYAVYWYSSGAVEVDIATGGKGSDAEGDTYVNIENVAGSQFNDKLTGDAGDNILEGLGGADTLDGGAHGELGDFADYSNSPGAVNVSLATGTGTLSDAEGDTLTNIENLIGSDGADTLTGDANDNVIEGRAGADKITGGGGACLATPPATRPRPKEFRSISTSALRPAVTPRAIRSTTSRT
jgi:Tol biopolymer transport system component/Ca2+-binding RTX toxin-like protein